MEFSNGPHLNISPEMHYSFRKKSWDLSAPNSVKVFGILNITPDSFSDGGKFLGMEQALRQADKMIEDGADALDIGGESTRPKAEPVSIEEERKRILPVLREVRRRWDGAISIDTSKAVIAHEALSEGADIINDVSAGSDPTMAHEIKEFQAGWIIMHMQGTPQTMQTKPHYTNVVKEVNDFFRQKVERWVGLQVRSEQLAIDPGIGFGKSVQHNVDLLLHLDELKGLGFPLMVGLSRKSFLVHLAGLKERDSRVNASVAAGLAAVSKGCNFLRVHDVKETVEALKVYQALIG
ncbi:MAG: dihydropteroate synthase [Verrucomicrobiota bacterium]|nr:dihydropteroate synthase [Verrucomicrobiota bacterium]